MTAEIQKQIFNTWYHLLHDDLLTTPYMSKLAKFLNLEYNNKKIYPIKKNIFKAFTDTDYNKLKVVVIGGNPYASKEDTGIAFANIEEIGGSLSLPLVEIDECVSRNVKDELYFMDYSLEDWSKQGILLLNSSLTAVEGQDGSHAFYWSYFMKYFLKTLSENNMGVIYCLWGNQAQSFKEHINPRVNYILECEHPNDAIKRNEQWNCTHFNEINKIIEKKDGIEECIDW